MDDACRRPRSCGGLAIARPRLIAGGPDVLRHASLRGDAAWGWVYMTLHGHYLDHLAVIEPWTEMLRVRQADGDPFVDDPRAARPRRLRARRTRASARSSTSSCGPCPLDRWDGDAITPGWTLRDHVGHLADWAAEGVRAIDVFHRRGHWLADPDEGIDAWNERHVAASRGESPAAALARYDATRTALLAAVGTLTVDELRSPDGWSWAYDCLHGHTRKHLAMLGPWCAATSWAPVR